MELCAPLHSHFFSICYSDTEFSQLGNIFTLKYSHVGLCLLTHFIHTFFFPYSAKTHRARERERDIIQCYASPVKASSDCSVTFHRKFCLARALILSLVSLSGLCRYKLNHGWNNAWCVLCLSTKRGEGSWVVFCVRVRVCLRAEKRKKKSVFVEKLFVNLQNRIEWNE